VVVASGDDAARVEVPDAERRMVEDQPIELLALDMARRFDGGGAERLRPPLQRQRQRGATHARRAAVDLDFDAVAAQARHAKRAFGRMPRVLH
jgi:hypothetical protein